MKYGIGIDTGGTFTDSVIVDLDSRSVVSKAKALTTKQDLKIGISNSIASLDSGLFPRVKIVSLSTTLATNSVVEGKGQRVGLIIAVPNEKTFQMPGNIPVLETAVLRGAHDRLGNETVPLDMIAGRRAISSMKGKVDAFAVSGYFGIYNARHERQLKDAVISECGCPVVCGHELTGAVGMVERATTAALNARLLPVIGSLLDAVAHILQERSIEAPLMVVRGDGSLISEKAARNRPVETILSGPAASLIGAGWLTGMADAVVVDMGGTTTDIGIITKARPGISENGAVIGGWQTRVPSVEMWTFGLGGDSKIAVESADSIRIGPARVEPLSHAASKHEELNLKLEELNRTDDFGTGNRGLEFYTLLKMPPFPLDRHERRVLDALDGRVLHSAEMEKLEVPWMDLDRFVNLGSVAEISFTPTDLLHASGALDFWDSQAAKKAVRYFAAKTGMSCSSLIEMIHDEILQKLLLNISARSLASDGITMPVHEDRGLLDSLLRLDGKGRTSVSLHLRYPLLAVGAPVQAYFPRVAERLRAKLEIPEHAEVANAVGAITGRVIASARALVRPVRPIGYTVVPMKEEKVFDELEPATEYAEQLARDMARTQAVEMGAGKIDVSVKSEEITAPLSGDYGKTVLMELKVTAIAVGDPYV